MCGRFTLHRDKKAIMEQLGLDQFPAWAPRYNIAPTQQVPIMVNAERHVDLMYWGMLSPWEKSINGKKYINARGETIGEKPTFKKSFLERRCLFLADGFYEWQQQDKGKQPYYVHYKDDHVFAMAGIWRRWQGDDQELIGASIITAPANRLMQIIHQRMPVIISQENFSKWLSNTTPVASLMTLLKPANGQYMHAYPVSNKVNSPIHDNPDCIAP